jgi:hypothetical protein
MQSGRVVQFGPQAERRDELEGVDYDKWMREPPPRDWMVEGCFIRGHVGLISGIGGVGKSLLMQQLATCATMGLPWLGIPLQRGRALMLACEDDDDELHRRQRDINRSLGLAMGDVLEAGLDVIARDDRENLLMELDRPTWRMKRTPLMDQLYVRCRKHGIQYLILDTVAKVYGGNQIDPRQVSDFVTEWHRFARDIAGIVLMTQHPSRSGRKEGHGESGSVQWESSVRSRLYFHEDAHNDLILEGRKANYSAKPKPIKLEWRKGVFEPIEAPPPRDYTEAGGYA